MRFSVVVPTINRASGLERLLDALRHQVHPDFEAIVVPGPCTDGTDALLTARADQIRVVPNDAAHLSRSRNLGAVAAAGELVAFIDDDAIPEPRWLARLDEAFSSDPELSVAGGFVRGPNGTSFQYRYSLCSRMGYASTHPEDPGDVLDRQGADPFRFIQGGNACFRREALREVGGFDEEIEFFHDETDLCARLLDRGHRLRVVPGADIIHRFEASARRDAHGRMKDPFAIVKNQVYFVHRHALSPGPGRDVADAAEAESELQRFADVWRDQAHDLHARGVIDDREHGFLLARVEEGLAAGAEAAAAEPRTRRDFPPSGSTFLRYPTVAARDGERRAIFVSSEFPPDHSGGIARFTAELSRGLSALGWETHVIVPGAEPKEDPLLIDHPEAQAASRRMTRVDMERGVWVHRVPGQVRAPRLTDRPLRDALDRAAAAHHAVTVLEERFGPAGVISAPLWTGDGLILSLDRGHRVVTTLMTTLKTVAGLHPSWEAGLRRLLALEGETLRHSRHLHAISAAILDGIRHDYPRETRGASADVIHLGVQDRRAAHPRRRPRDGRLRILFVGRLERRKGVEELLAAAAPVLRRRPEAELVLVGQDTLSTEIGRTYREAFVERHADEPELLARVTFTGAVGDEDLYAHYADADLFTAPSRYESFGLVHAEAMMMGLPMIACASGGTIELVVDGETGRLVPVDDVDALEAALDELVAAPAKREAMGAAARARYEACFTLEHAATATSRAYAAIADAPPAPGERVDAARALGESLERVAGLGAHVAREVADHLLDPADEDAFAAVRRAWHAPDEVFVEELYRGVLLREPDQDGRAAFVHELEHGRERADLVREIGWSDEAQAHERDTAWLGDLLELDGWTEERACALAFSQPTDARFVQDITDLLIADAAQRARARDHAASRLAAGESRLAAALALLDAGLSVRNAPDFVGWEPMLGHLGQGASTSSSTPPSKARRRIGALAGRARTTIGRARRSISLLEQSDARGHAVAEAVGRLESESRQALAALEVATGEREALRGRIERLIEQVSQGHATAGETSERVWQAIEQLMHKVDVVEHHADLRAEHAAERNREVLSGVVVNSQRVDILQRKLEALATDLRERLPARPLPDELPKPVIPDNAAYEAKLEALGGELRLNLGAGEKPLDDYVNVDSRPLEGIEVVADVRRLPFADATVSEITSAHLVEHFRSQQLTVSLLPYWRGLLRPGGVLRVICPNWEAMTEHLADGRMGWTEFKVLTFGLQDYDGDDHFAMYTPAALRESLEAAGFSDVELAVEERMNGICPEMELTARRPQASDDHVSSDGSDVTADVEA